MWQLGKRAFGSYWDCFSHSWEVIFCVLCKCDREKNRVDVFFHLTFFCPFFFVTHSFTSSPFSSPSLHVSLSVTTTPTSFVLLPPLFLFLPLLPFISPYPSISLVHIFQSTHNTSLPPYKSPSFSLALSPSQVTPARPLIRILSLSKCIVTGG